MGIPMGRDPVTFARNTGQERDEERNAIVAKPPDILLTNYVMLELILTRVSPSVSTHYTGCGSVEGAV